MSALICGSIAFDNIMVFHDRFKNHILPEQIHILNVAFLVPEMRRELGGCAGNIAYNMHLLGAKPLIMATVGDDAAPYLAKLQQLGLDTRHIRTIPGSLTAQAFITTDLDDNQITAFHPGAMSFSHHNQVTPEARLGIVAPDGRDGMIEHARQFAEAGIPFIFDPGQGLPMFSGDDLLTFMRQATWACFNDYEAKLLSEKTGQTLEQLSGMVEALIVTRGGEGSDIYQPGKVTSIPVVPAEVVVDPTGCGDAYRGGLLYGLQNGWSIEKSARLASLMGSIKIAQAGPQNHTPSRQELAERFLKAFGETLDD